MRKDQIAIAVIAGSHAYGMETVDSDIDLKGIFIPDVNCYLDGSKQEQFQDKEKIKELCFPTLSSDYQEKAQANGMEGVFYELNRFVDLASTANPNILDILFCRDEDVIHSNWIGEELRRNRNNFLTKKCLQTFVGYATAQMKKMETHRKWLINPPLVAPTKEEFGLKERQQIPHDQILAATSLIKKQIDSWSIDFADLDEATKIYIEDQIAKNLAEMNVSSKHKFSCAGKLLGYDDNFMEMIVAQREYDSAMNHFRSYEIWKKERNKKRQGMEAKIGYDVKHAAHLYRLILACKYLFENGELIVYNPNPFLLDIRRGNVAYDVLMQNVNAEKDNLSKIAVSSNLPKSVDKQWISDLVISILKKQFSISI
jgi:predicted nucleotidyltransferase